MGYGTIWYDILLCYIMFAKYTVYMWYVIPAQVSLQHVPWVRLTFSPL